ncbi:MAG: response regulator [Bacteroidales bacterium]|nr:response regulator [Bacteroidales bacterium]
MKEMNTLLYVDDESINLRMFALVFKDKFNVITAESGYEALDKLKMHPDTAVVITDMRMPGMDGLEFIRTAKKEFPGISFFILTGYDISEEITAAVKEGLIYKYFGKPFNIKEIETSIYEALRLL